MKDQKYALLVDYTYFTGAHSAELAARNELGLDRDQYPIKEIEVGPFELKDEDGEKSYEWNYIPVPTSIFSKHWGTGGDKAGQTPQACVFEESASLYYGTVEDMAEKMMEFDRPMVLFQL